MLSKSKGQILRVAAGFHVSFHLGSHNIIPSEISNEAIVAVRDFVDMCNQHVAFMAGKGEIDEYIASLIAGIVIIGCCSASAFHLYSIVISLSICQFTPRER